MWLWGKMRTRYTCNHQEINTVDTVRWPLKMLRDECSSAYVCEAKSTQIKEEAWGEISYRTFCE